MARKITKPVVKKATTKKVLGKAGQAKRGRRVVPPKKGGTSNSKTTEEDKWEETREAAQEMVRKSAEKILGRPIPRKGEQAPHGIVRARAGTGKTFTLIMGVAKVFGHKI